MHVYSSTRRSLQSLSKERQNGVYCCLQKFSETHDFYKLCFIQLDTLNKSIELRRTMAKHTGECRKMSGPSESIQSTASVLRSNEIQQGLKEATHLSRSGCQLSESGRVTGINNNSFSRMVPRWGPRMI